MAKRILSIVTLAMVLAVAAPLPLGAQASQVNCRVPFSFIVSGRTMPAGLYTLSMQPRYIRVQGLSASAFALTNSDSGKADGRAKAVFLKNGDQYHLAEVWTGDGSGRAIPVSKRELQDRRASNAPIERVVVLGM
jgi:hypothetical protein